MVEGDKVRVIDRENDHGLKIGEVVNVLYVDDDGTIKVDDPDCGLTWWLWGNEYELLNQEQ